MLDAVWSEYSEMLVRMEPMRCARTGKFAVVCQWLKTASGGRAPDMPAAATVQAVPEGLKGFSTQA